MTIKLSIDDLEPDRPPGTIGAPPGLFGGNRSAAPPAGGFQEELRRGTAMGLPPGFAPPLDDLALGRPFVVTGKSGVVVRGDASLDSSAVGEVKFGASVLVVETRDRRRPRERGARLPERGDERGLLRGPDGARRRELLARGVAVPDQRAAGRAGPRRRRPRRRVGRAPGRAPRRLAPRELLDVGGGDVLDGHLPHERRRADAPALRRPRGRQLRRRPRREGRAGGGRGGGAVARGPLRVRLLEVPRRVRVGPLVEELAGPRVDDDREVRPPALQGPVDAPRRAADARGRVAGGHLDDARGQFRVRVVDGFARREVDDDEAQARLAEGAAPAARHGRRRADREQFPRGHGGDERARGLEGVGRHDLALVERERVERRLEQLLGDVARAALGVAAAGVGRGADGGRERDDGARAGLRDRAVLVPEADVARARDGLGRRRGRVAARAEGRG